MASVLLPVEKTIFSPLAQRVLEPIRRIAYFRLPLKNRFRRVTEREGLLLQGPAGWAEVSPFWDYDARESAHWLQAGLELACENLDLPVYRQQIPINLTVPVVSPERALEIVAEFLASVTENSFVTAKVKVADPGVTLTEDCARLEAVRAGLGARGRIRVDANAAWTVSEAVSAVRELDRAAGGLEYVEQPCLTVEDLASVRRQISVPVAADESVRRAEDPLRVARLNAADVLVVKLQPMAGIKRILQVVEQAQLPVVVSSALDSSVGIAAGLRLAAYLPQLDYACGLGTARMFTGDVVDSPLIPEGGFLPVATVAPNWQQVSAQTATDFDRERISAWVERLNAMVSYL